MIKAGAINSPNSSGFHSAAISGNMEKLRDILRTGVDINLKHEPTGRTALMMALHKNNHKCVKYLLDNKADVNVHDCDGFTAIHHAATRDLPECIDLLLIYDSKINTFSSNATWISRTPLMMAIASNSHRAIESLVHHGANLTLTTNIGESVLDLALEMHNDRAVHIIRTALAARQINEIIEASTVKSSSKPCSESIKRDIEIIKQDMVSGAGIYIGYAALHYAAARNMDEYIEILVHDGADINAFSSNATGFARTPLMISITQNSHSSTQTLINLGADLTLVTKDGQSALDIALDSFNAFAVDLIRTSIASRQITGAIVEASDYMDPEIPVPRRRGPGIL